MQVLAENAPPRLAAPTTIGAPLLDIGGRLTTARNMILLYNDVKGRLQDIAPFL